MKMGATTFFPIREAFILKKIVTNVTFGSDGHNDVRAVTDLPYFSFKIATTLNLTLECKTVSYWLKF